MQLGLRVCGSYPVTGGVVQPNAQLARDHSGNFQGLVKAPFSVAKRVQWHGNDDLWQCRGGVEAFRQQGSKQSGVGMTGSKFEGLDEVTDGLLVPKGTDHPVKWRWLLEAGPAQGKVALGEREAASPAGVAQIRQCLSAVSA